MVTKLLILMTKFTAPCFDNPQYELVALHSEYFLPNGCPLTIYDHETGTYKNYVAARDGCLRETADPSSHCLPPFHHRAVSREASMKPNVYLVALNAEIKFRRYLKMVEATPPPTPLPDHVLSLIHRTIELIRLIYWRPTPTKGSKGESVLAQQKLASRRTDPERAARPGPSKNTEGGSGEELEAGAEEVSQAPPSKRRRNFRWPADWDLEARMHMGGQ
jgi:hypothetical protein